MGLGMVLRDDTGKFVVGRMVILPGCTDVDVREAMWFAETLSWAREMGLSNIVVQGDSKVIIDTIHSSHHMESAFEDFVQASRNILASCLSFTINFVMQDANVMAHVFAQTSQSFESPHVWIDPPTFVEGLEINNCSCERTI